MASQEDLALERRIQMRKMEFKNEILKIVAENNDPESLASALIDKIFQSYIGSDVNKSSELEKLQSEVNRMLSMCYLSL